MKLSKSKEAAYWYRYIDTALIYNSWDSACEAENGADKDGDTNMCTDNPIIVNRTLNSPTIICLQKKAEKIIPTEDDIIKANKQEYENDKTIYTYCGVLLPFSSRPYSFRTEDDSIKIGDTVIVTVGEDKKEMKGKIVSVGQYSRLGVPYPVEKTKSILRKVDNETE